MKACFHFPTQLAIVCYPLHHSLRTGCPLNSAMGLALQLRNFNDLKFISFAAAVMSLGYSTIAIGNCPIKVILLIAFNPMW